MTANQTQTLMKRFEAKPQLEKGEVHQLAETLNLTENRIVVWFNNARYKRRRKGLLAQGEER